MQLTAVPTRSSAATATAQPTAEPTGAGGLLLRLCRLLDEAGVPFCILHGYEQYPAQVTSDVDCLMSPDVLPHRLATLLREHRGQLKAEVVQWLAGASHFITLAGHDDADGTVYFLQLHVSTGCDIRRRRLYSAGQVLAGRRRHRDWWVPAVGVEFACYLARRLSRRGPDEGHVRRLNDLYEQDTAGCELEVERLWSASDAAAIKLAATTGDWSALRQDAAGLTGRLVRRTTVRRPLRWLADTVAGTLRVGLRRLKADRGFCVVFLGPDGAGKSSVVRNVTDDLKIAFSEVDRRSFPPALRGTGGGGTQTSPHAVKPRSPLSSAARAVGYWWTYYAVGYFVTVRPKLASNHLVIYDRHPMDALVDARRYRYGGPTWLLRLVTRLLPRPHLVILLDAPAQVLQSRKQEVPFEETARQVSAYRGLIDRLPNGRRIDASQPLGDVVADVRRLILSAMADRVSQAFGK